jgi:hypothetical protein
MDTPPANPESEIPELPGHYRRTAWYFMRWWLVFVASMGVLAMGMEWQIITMQIAGGAGCFVALMGLMTTIGRAGSAACPSCSTMMSQGWDAKSNGSDGIFRCPGCGKKWRTKATWGMD